MTNRIRLMRLGLLLLILLATLATISAQAFAAPLETAVLQAEPAEPVEDVAVIELNEYDPFARAAELIGMDVEALWEAVDSGQSIADVATANGVEPQTIIDALVAEEEALIAEMVAAGELSEEEAAEWNADLISFMTEFVNEAFDFDEFADWEDPFVKVGELLGLDEEGLWTALENGQTIAELAEANGVEPAAVVAVFVEVENEYVDELLASGEISEEEAAEWKAEIETYANELVFGNLWDEAIEGEWVDDFYAPVAELLGLDEQAMWDALDGGQSLAELAEAQGVEVQAVKELLLEIEQEFIDELLAAGEISEEEADAWRAELDAYVDAFVNDSLDAFFEEIDESAEFEIVEEALAN